MIKEIAFKHDKKGDSLYSPIELNIDFLSPIKERVNILKQISFIKNQLDNKALIAKSVIQQGDWISINKCSQLVCVSLKFRKLFEYKLKGHWYDLKNSDYSLFLLDNCIKGLDVEQSKIVNTTTIPYWYDSIENEVYTKSVDNEYIFTLIYEPLRWLCNDNFFSIVKENQLKGITFYNQVNFKRKDGSRFDGLRNKKYDEEGNCLE